MNRRAPVIAVAVLQVAVLAYMAAEREIVLRTGRTVWLRTAPVDPQDAFRGDYVSLNYEVSRAPRRLFRDGLAAAKDVRRDMRVYATLKTEAEGISELEYLSDRRPAGGDFIRGRTEPYSAADVATVRYGIEALFVQQGKGRVLEDARRRGDILVPLEMRVAVGANGLCVLRDYRWSRLGIGLKLETNTNRVTRAAVVKLMNASSNDLAIVDLPGGESLSLETDWLRSWGEKDWTWVGTDKPRPAVAEEHVRLLKPGETHEIPVNLMDPAWFVSKPGEKPKPLADLGWGASFRLVYRPPSADECRHLRQSVLIWHGTLSSRAFSGGRID